MKVIIITGTDGKTTSSTLLYNILKEAGKKVALISTVGAYIGGKEIDTGFHVTTPTPWQLQKLINKIADQKCEYLILETTSQGAYQYRTWGIRPLIAGVTNITHDHLDYHLSVNNYLMAKLAKVIQAKHIVINKDDSSFSQVSKVLAKNKKSFQTYDNKMHVPPNISSVIDYRFEQAYNRMNALLAYKISLLLDIDEIDIELAIKHFPNIPGRMQLVKNSEGKTIIVDFAHTPNALRELLTSLQPNRKKGRLIAVYGCAGLRDISKRPAMGKAGVDLADQVVFTAEDPRTENVWSIIRQMKEQLTIGHHKITSIADRYQAIEYALKKLAKSGDTIVIAGKGHEKSMCYGKIEYPWSDVQAVNQILKNKVNLQT